jgi:4-aminobutyrate aminotransferase
VLNTPYTAADDVAALIIEPQQGEGGYLVPPPGYLEILKKACENCGALFIADEVQAGAGRSGRMWSIEHSDVVPDMLTWGKGLGGDLPMAGVTFKAEFADNLEDSSQPGTFAGNALSAAVCITNIDILTDKDYGLMGRAVKLGEETRNRISAASKDIRIIGDVRGRGLFIGVELVGNRETREPLPAGAMGTILSDLLKKGVIAVPCGRYHNVIRFMPPLTITRAYLEKAVDIVLDVCKKQ